jgi:4-hydroxy-3-polyprenylbenzoate decarboxylase
VSSLPRGCAGRRRTRSSRVRIEVPMLELHPSRLIVGITGATGAIFGVRLLEALRRLDVETHLIVSKWGAHTLAEETSYSLERVRQMATYSYPATDQGAAVSSGSFLTSGMVVAPCSVRTLAAIASGQGDNLIHRAADVILKERRKLVLLVRETPLNEIHLENMLKLSRMGAVILPPMPAFYNHPQSIDAMVDHVVMRTLDQFGIHTDLAERWGAEVPAESSDR